MKIQKKLMTMLSTALILCGSNAFSQDNLTQTERNEITTSQRQSPGNTNFVLAGYTYSGFEKEGDGQGSFGPAGFSPIFLWKKSDKLFFEGEMEMEIEDGEVNFGLEYSTLHYVLNKYFTVSAGKFLSPFGTYAERLHPKWIDKFAEKPLGFSEEGAMVGPMGEFGVSLRGGSQLGNAKINYVAYLSNGPSLITDDPAMAGQLMYDNLADNNNNKAIGGRLGFLPFSNSSLEIGVSGQTAKVGDKGSEYEHTGVNLFSGDISFIHKVGFMDLNIKGQYNQVNVDAATYKDEEGNNLNFDNNSKAYFLQLALRPAFIRNKFIKNIEFAGRYSAMNLPEKSLWAGNQSQIGLGLNYWLNWNSVLKIDYMIDQVKGEEKEGAINVQIAFGF